MPFESTTQKITWFRDRYREGSLELKPPYQRKPVWSAKQKQYLIESILLSLPIPEIYLHISLDAEDKAHYFVVDGQQRIRTVLQFLGVDGTPGEEDWNQFSLDKLPATSDYRDATFSSLSKSDREALLTYSLSVRELKNVSDEQVRDIFKRFNKYVTKLNDQEIRHATYSGPFIGLAERLADQEYWVQAQLVTPNQIRRMKDVEFVSELLIGTMHGPQAGSPKAIDDYYAQYDDFEEEFPGQSSTERRFERVLRIVSRVLPLDSESRFRTNRTDFYTLFVAIAGLLVDHSFADSAASQLRKSVLTLGGQIDKRITDENASVPSNVARYVRAVEKGANDKKRRTERHEVVTERIRHHFKKRQG